ncbi:MAG: molybdopterin-dependent oxidoreductase [Desulfobacteraceae bacterium]|nr:molybdopterin-dependent oxidoreductase [Desulfobacteraceae bacterium]
MEKDDKARWIKTHCGRFDHGGCGLEVLVRDGRPASVRADRSDPYSKGYCCAKGLASIERSVHPERLTRPLLRKGERGAGEWEQIPWDRALGILADRFGQAIRASGPESVAFAQGAPKGLEFFILMRLANLLQVPTVGAAQHVCHMPREQMAVATCGFYPVPDYDRPTRCILLWGSDPERTNEEGILGGRFLDGLKAGARLIVVDPVRTGPAQRADLWLQIRPGTDDLLAAGLLHCIIEEELFDRDFVEVWTTGFSDLREAVGSCTPEAVSAGTGVPREKILEAARLYAESRPALLHWGNAVEHTANSSQTCRALVSLMAVTGNLESPGGNIRAEAPNVMRLVDLTCLKSFPGRADKLLNRRYGLIPRLLTTPNWILFRTILERPGSLRCLYLQGTNPLLTCANPQEVRDALLRLDFIALADIFMTPTAALADLVLPAATNLEFDDIGHYGLPHGHLFARPSAVNPPGEAWPDIRILNEWGKRMGLEAHFWDDAREIVEAVLKPAGMTYADFAAKGMLSGRKPYFSYREKGFATPSGKVELRSSLLEKWGYPPLPFVAPHMGPDDSFPLLLTSRKPRYFFHSAYRQIASLRGRDRHPGILVHPGTAAKLRISEGERVMLSTASGAIKLTARISESVHPDVVVADFGWWFPERSGEGFGLMESNLNCVIGTNGPKDPILGTLQLRALPCRLEKIDHCTK